ncbi:MAG: hypothetical protein E7464_05085, partial [Ruminococcaceae bacterium]|nr:hypothetical protein [Oscillospiraceae bacterium]
MKLHSRVLALILCLVMVLGMLPTAVLAADEEVADVLESINFMDSASADKFTVVNQSTTKINEGEGLYLVSTTTAMEPCNGQVTAGAPADLVEIPVEGDWTATIKFQFNQGGSQGYYEFFGFYAAEGDDYANMAGIRGGDGAIQNFLSQDGSITADTDGIKTSSGLKSAGTHWFRIAKEGDTYTCFWSTDGQNFTETFGYEATGIEADKLVIDAYSGMSTGYNYTVEYLYFGDDTDAMNEYALDALVDMVIGKIPEIIPIKVNDTFTLPKGAKGCTVTYTAEPDCIEGNKIIAMEEETEVALTVTISGNGVDVSKTLNVTVPAAGTSDIPVTKFQVTFVPNAAGLENVVVEVEEDDYVTVPEELTRTGYAATWRNGNAAFNFDTPITQNLTLTASWTKDWYAMYSLGDEYADFFPMGCFGGQIGNTQTDTQYRTLSGNNGKLTYNIGGGRDSNGSGTTSRQAYDAAVARINADTSLSAEEKAAQIEEANRNVELVSGDPALFSTLRAIRNWNQANPDKPQKYYRQHVLAWHGSEQPKYFFCNGFNYNSSNPDWASPETMLARLDNYIMKMMERYSQFNDVILSWDVVNEALDCYTGQVRNYETYQVSEWGLIFRREDLDDDPDARLEAETVWIRQAFESARKWTEYYDCDWTLYYNDYHDSNKLYEPKMSQTVKMLKPIYEAGNIDGYGMQARLAYAYPTIDMLREQIELGLTVADEFSFSEADIRSDFEPNPNYDPEQPTRRTVSGDPVWPNNSGYYANISRDNGNTFDVHNSPVYRNPDWGVGSLSSLATDPEIMKKQADFAADLMDLVLSFEGKCGAIAWDGYHDGSTFNGTTGCHMWDRNSNEKYSFYAVIGAPNRYKMNEAIAAGPDLSDESLYTAESWAPYEAAVKEAKSLVDVRIYTDAGVKAVKEATADLIAATEALVEDEGGEVATKYNVTFDYNYPGAPDPVVVQVAEGQTVEPIDAPDREGYVFTSWGTEMSFWGWTFVTPYDFATPVTADITLKASWDKDWSMMPSLAEEYDDFFVQGCFGGSIGQGQTDHHYATLSGNNGKLTYNIGGSRDSDGSNTTSRNAYDAAVAAINADDSLTAEEKAAKIEEANRNVELVAGEPALFNTLRAIREWNEANPDKPKKYYRQHVLAWHGSEQPKYFFCNGFNYNSADPDWASPETMLARLDNYIMKMMERYSQFNDVILSWDVVNEAIDCYTGQIRNYETYQVSEWGLIFRRPDLDDKPEERLYEESVWVRQAFESARKWTDYYECDWTLYYNDFQDSNKLYEPKMSNTIKMLEPIYEAGNIDGYGMQARLSYAYPTIDMLREQITKGLTVADEISFSEADIRSDFEPNPNYDPEQPTRRVTADDPVWPENSGNFPSISSDNGNTFDVHNSPVYRNPDWGVGALSDLATDPEIMKKQADFAADLMDLLLFEFTGKVAAVAWDGNNDGSTFNRTTGCQMWDRNNNEKYSY